VISAAIYPALRAEVIDLSVKKRIIRVDKTAGGEWMVSRIELSADQVTTRRLEKMHAVFSRVEATLQLSQ